MTKLNVLTDETKIDEIKKAATGGRMRKLYDSFELAKAAFDKASPIAVANGIPVNAPNADDFPEGVRAAVAVVGERKRNPVNQKMEPGIKALVLFPIPTADAFIAEAAEWIAKIVEKEAAHVAFRELRNAGTSDELTLAFEKMPKDVATFVASSASEGVDTDTFDTLWLEFRRMLKANLPQLVELLPGKPEVLKALRSKPYAMAEHEALESKGIFVWLGNALIAAAADWKANGEPDPLDDTTLRAWLATRDENDSIRKAAEKPKDFSVLDSLNLNFGDEEDGESEAEQSGATA